jgi:hypothetical protein
MGYKVTDGKAFNATAPTSQVITDYDLYRIGGWNGVAIGSKDGTQTDRAMAFEADPAAIYSVLLPSGITPAVGDFLFWATNDATTFQRGDTNLVLVANAANGQLPCAQVIKVKNAAGYARIRVMQSGAQAIKFGT